MELKDFLSGVLSKTLNIDADGVASLFNEDGTVKEDAEKMVLELNAKHVSAIKAGSKQAFIDEGYGKAQREIMTKFESDFKAKTGFKSEKKGIDLVLDYANSQRPADSITEDVIKKHPLYLTLQEEKESAILKAKEEGEKALNQFKGEISKKESFNRISLKGLELFHKEKPVLSKDPIRAKAQEEMFIEKLAGFDFEEQGERIVVLKDGKVYENGQGHPYSFEKLAKEITTKYFDLHVAEPKSSPGNSNQNGNSSEGKKIEAPKNQNDFLKVIADSSIPVQDRQNYQQQYGEQFKTI